MGRRCLVPEKREVSAKKQVFRPCLLPLPIGAEGQGLLITFTPASRSPDIDREHLGPKWLNAMRRYRLKPLKPYADTPKRLGLPLWRILFEGLVKNFAELLLLLFWIP